MADRCFFGGRTHLEWPFFSVWLQPSYICMGLHPGNTDRIGASYKASRDGGRVDKVRATGERCRGRVMTTQRVVNAFMSRVAL